MTLKGSSAKPGPEMHRIEMFDISKRPIPSSGDTELKLWWYLAYVHWNYYSGIIINMSLFTKKQYCQFIYFSISESVFKVVHISYWPRLINLAVLHVNTLVIYLNTQKLRQIKWSKIWHEYVVLSIPRATTLNSRITDQE